MELRVCCVSQLHQHRRVGSQHVVQASGVECQTESCRAFSVRVEVAMRKTHNTTISQSSPSISSNQSHSSSQSPHSLRPNPTKGEQLASRSCEAGLSQGHPHIARYHTTTCQQLPTPQREAHSTTPLNPFQRAGFTHVTLEVDDIAVSCISRVATATCSEG
jgi:hypothetical protein